MYADPTDLLTRYGADEIAELTFEPGQEAIYPDNKGDLLKLTLNGGDRSAWSADEQAAADAAANRLAVANTDAANLIDSYVAGQYDLPLSSEVIAKSNLPRAQVVIARYYLHDDDPTETVQKRFDNEIKWLRDIGGGKVNLGATSETVQTTGGSVVRQSNSRFDWGAY